ncbi:hypothetical protein AC579_1768 [Pseudocercospora musae]|uniref:Uncharacterized protein n=1 Tax=Pseudocercospora musae TaxID=113226 RepID=A0A139INY3_9PEZI|nr:hypothetical protein AC579_1768 [Pseudocercospora musae]
MARDDEHSDTEALIPTPDPVELDSRVVSAGSSFHSERDVSIQEPSNTLHVRRSSEAGPSSPPQPIELQLLRPRSVTPATRGSFQSDRSSQELVRRPSMELEALRTKRNTLRGPPVVRKLIPFFTSHPPLASSMIVIPLVVLPFALGVISAYRKPSNGAAGTCLPGSTKVVSEVDPWSIDNIVAITLPVAGGLSFTEAKFLDIFWDLIIGRGGQLLLLYISYHAFSQVLTNMLPTNQLTCDTYAAVAFDNGTLKGASTLARDFWRRRYPRTRYTMGVYVVMILSGLFIFAWPTLLSAMTSYGAVMIAEVTVDGETLQLSSFTPCWGIVSNASRVGLENDFIIPADVPEQYNMQVQQTANMPSSQARNLSAAESLYEYYRNHTGQYEDYQRLGYHSITDNVSIIYPNGRSSESQYLNGASVFKHNNSTTNLESPLLTIHVLVGNNGQKGFGCWYQNRTTNRKVVTGYEILDTPAGKCTPTEKYQWGFSFCLLFLTSLFTAIWFCAVLTLSSQERYRTDVPNHGYTPHFWRAVADLGRILSAEVGDDGHVLPTPELKRTMKSKRMRAAEGHDDDSEEG